MPTGHLTAVYLRVADVDRTARFFASLFDAKFERKEDGSHTEQKMVNRLRATYEPIDAVFTDASEAPPARLCFACEDPEAALERLIALGGSVKDAGRATDDQVVPLRFASPVPPVPPDDSASGALGVVIVQVPDTERARELHGELFGQAFVKVGAGDYWWVDSGPSWGVFPITHDLTNPPVPLDRTGTELAAFFCVTDLPSAMGRVVELGGETSGVVSFGPYATCPCRDDQGFAFGLWQLPS